MPRHTSRTRGRDDVWHPAGVCTGSGGLVHHIRPEPGDTVVGAANIVVGASNTLVHASNTLVHASNTLVRASNTPVGASNSAVGTFDSAVGTFDSAVGTFYSAVGTFYSAVGTFGSAVGTLYSAVGTFGSAVGTLYSAVGTFGSAVGTFGSAVGTFGSAVGTFYSAVGTFGTATMEAATDTPASAEVIRGADDGATLYYSALIHYSFRAPETLDEERAAAEQERQRDRIAGHHDALNAEELIEAWRDGMRLATQLREGHRAELHTFDVLPLNALADRRHLTRADLRATAGASCDALWIESKFVIPAQAGIHLRAQQTRAPTGFPPARE